MLFVVRAEQATSHNNYVPARRQERARSPCAAMQLWECKHKSHCLSTMAMSVPCRTTHMRHSFLIA